MPDQYRFENIRGATVNGRPLLCFDTFEYNADQRAYIYIGQFSAPPETPHSKLGEMVEAWPGNWANYYGE